MNEITVTDERDDFLELACRNYCIIQGCDPDAKIENVSRWELYKDKIKEILFLQEAIGRAHIEMMQRNGELPDMPLPHFVPPPVM